MAQDPRLKSKNSLIEPVTWSNFEEAIKIIPNNKV
jgi:hypothetical protein